MVIVFTIFVTFILANPPFHQRYVSLEDIWGVSDPIVTSLLLLEMPFTISLLISIFLIPVLSEAFPDTTTLSFFFLVHTSVSQISTFGIYIHPMFLQIYENPILAR